MARAAPHRAALRASTPPPMIDIPAAAPERVAVAPQAPPPQPLTTVSRAPAQPQPQTPAPPPYKPPPPPDRNAPIATHTPD